MIQVMREKFGRTIIFSIIGLIAFVFVFEGVFNSSRRLTRGGSFAGSVNGEPITVSDFNRALAQKTEQFKNLFGGKLTPEQMKMFRIKEAVFQEITSRKVMLIQADKQNWQPSDAAVREAILKMPVFQKDGQFDKLQYEQVLRANQYTPTSFEKLMRDDLTMNLWKDSFSRYVTISDLDVRQDFTLSKETRSLKYVFIPSKEEDRKKNESLADEIVKTFDGSQASEGRVTALLKDANASGVKIETADKQSRKTLNLKNVTDAKQLTSDAFQKNSPIRGKAKKYSQATGILVAVVTEAVSADPSELTVKEAATIKSKLATNLQGELFQEWMNRNFKKARVEKNEALLNENES